jgi:hypothetical protein
MTPPGGKAAAAESGLGVTAPAQAASPITATLFTHQLTWMTTPRTRVSAELRDGGLVVGTASATSDPDGRVSFRFQQSDRFGPSALLVPGRAIVLTAENEEPLVVEIPDVSADADADVDRVVGTAPAGASVDLEVEIAAAGKTMHYAVVADAAGSFSVGVGFVLGLRPGDGGRAVYVDADGHTFVAAFYILTADVRIDSESIVLQGTPGTELGITTVQADGTRTDGARQLLRNDGRLEWATRVTGGEQLGFEQVGGPLGGSRWITVTVPVMSVEADATADVVRGTGPPSTELLVEGQGPRGEHQDWMVTTDATGVFELALGPDFDLKVGWRLYLTMDLGRGIRAQRLAVTNQARVAVHTPTITGLAHPRRPITATLYAPSGDPLAQKLGYTNADGGFWLSFEGFDPDTGYPVEHPITPGSGVEVAFVGGDPVFLVVPDITARTDPDADTVSGIAPPGARLRLTTLTAEPAITRALQADYDGTYRVDLAGSLDIAPPATGNVSVYEDRGHEFQVAWSAVGLTVSLAEKGEGVSGNGQFGRAVSVTLQAPDGAVVATGSGRVDNYGNRLVHEWHTYLRDSLGKLVAPLPGDSLHVLVGDDEIEYTVQKLDAVLHVEDDVVSGGTAADVPVTIWLRTGLAGDEAAATVRSDGQGIFSHDFSATADILYNNAGTVEADGGRHTLRRRIGAPGLTLILSEPQLRGSIEPLLDATVELRDDRGLRLRVPVRTDLNAVFTADLHTASGEPVVPEPGDVISVAAPGAAHFREVRLEVPDLVVRLDADSDTVSGTAQPGSRLTFFVEEFFARGRYPVTGSALAEIAPDGSYATTVSASGSGTIDLRTGHTVAAWERLPSGHIVQRAEAIPLVNAQHGGTNVCGAGHPLDEATAALLDADNAVHMTASGRVQPNTWFELALQEPKGEHRFSVAGLTVRARLGDETFDVDLPEMSVAVDWGTGVVSGTGPRRTDVYLYTGARDCIGHPYAHWIGTTDGAGLFESDPLDADELAQGVQVAFFTLDGHRFYRQIFRSLGSVYVHRSRIAGSSMPLSPVAITVLGPDGAERAEGAAFTDSDGSFDLDVSDAQGQPVTIEPGDTVVMVTTGEAPRIRVEELDFDLSVSGGIEGFAPAGREVELTYTLADGGSVKMTRQTDDRGRFVLTPAMLPPRSEWSFADVVHVRAVLQTPNGHHMVAEADVGEPEPAPLYLPLTTR